MILGCDAVCAFQLVTPVFDASSLTSWTINAHPHMPAITHIRPAVVGDLSSASMRQPLLTPAAARHLRRTIRLETAAAHYAITRQQSLGGRRTFYSIGSHTAKVAQVL